MSERYVRLYTLPSNLYVKSAPLIVSAGALLLDQQTDNVLAQLKFKNISTKTITSLRVSLKAFDASGKELQPVSGYVYPDLFLRRDEEAGQKTAIPFPNKLTRSYTCQCDQVGFSDGTAWEAPGAEYQPLLKPAALTEQLGTLAAQYQRDTNSQAKFVVTDDRDLWLCPCGAINSQTENACHICGAKRDALLSALDTNLLSQHYAAYTEKKKKEQAKRKAEQKANIIKRGKLALGIVAALVVLFFAVRIIGDIKEKADYAAATALLDAGNFAEAKLAFEALGDCDEEIRETCYQESLFYMRNAQYTPAAQGFMRITDYKDAYDQYIECLYQDALLHYQSNSYRTAIRKFNTVLYAVAAKAKGIKPAEQFFTLTENKLHTFPYKDTVDLIKACKAVTDAPSKQEGNNEEAPASAAPASDDDAPLTTPAPKTQKGYINANQVNLRAEPNTESEILAVMDKNTEVDVYPSDTDWNMIVADGKTGYVRNDFLEYEEQHKDEADTDDDKDSIDRISEEYHVRDMTRTEGYASAEWIILRAKPTTDSKKLGQFDYLTTFTITGETDEWYRVILNGKNGFICRWYVGLGDPWAAENNLPLTPANLQGVWSNGTFLLQVSGSSALLQCDNWAENYTDIYVVGDIFYGYSNGVSDTILRIIRVTKDALDTTIGWFYRQ